MNRRIVRINPLRDMVEMQRALDRFFDEAWNAKSNGNGNGFALPLDVIEHNNHYFVRADLPGVTEENIEISLDGDVLHIAADIPGTVIDDEAEDLRLLMNERRSGRYSRSLTLSKAVDADKVEALYENGVLTLSLPFVPEVQPRQISISRKA